MVERGEEAEVTVGWFVAHWMPFAAEAKPKDTAPRETAAQAAQRATTALAEARRLVASGECPALADSPALRGGA